MNDEEFDIEKFIDLFDTAMTSDNPTVRRAFKNLLIVAALVDSETPPKSAGPMRALYNQIDDLRTRISQVELSKYSNSNYGKINTIGTYPSTNNPTWTINNIPPVTYSVTGGGGGTGYATSTLDNIYTGLIKNNDE